MKIEEIKKKVKKIKMDSFWTDFFKVSFEKDGKITINGFVEKTDCGIDETWERWKMSDGKRAYQKTIDNITIVLCMR